MNKEGRQKEEGQKNNASEPVMAKAITANTFLFRHLSTLRFLVEKHFYGKASNAETLSHRRRNERAFAHR